MTHLIRNRCRWFTSLSIVTVLLAGILMVYAPLVHADTQGDPSGFLRGDCTSSGDKTQNSIFPANSSGGYTTNTSSTTLYLYAESFYCGGGTNSPHNITYGNYGGAYCAGGAGDCVLPDEAFTISVTGSYSFSGDAAYNSDSGDNLGSIRNYSYNPSSGYYVNRRVGTLTLGAGCHTISVKFGVGAEYPDSDYVSSNGASPSTYTACAYPPSTGNISFTCSAGVQNYSSSDASGSYFFDVEKNDGGVPPAINYGSQNPSDFVPGDTGGPVPGWAGPGKTYDYMWLFVKNAAGNYYLTDSDPIPSNSTCQWSLTGSTTGSPNPVVPGGTATFANKVKNAGPATSSSLSYGGTYFYSATDYTGNTVKYNNSTGATTVGSDVIPNASLVNGTVNGNPALTSGISTPVLNQTATIPAATTSPYICGFVRFTPADSDGTTNARGNAYCLPIVNPAPVSCSTKTVPVGNVVAGQSFSVITKVTYLSNTTAAAVQGSGGQAFYTLKNGATTLSSGTSSDAGDVSGATITHTFTVSAQPVASYTVFGGVQGATGGYTAGNTTCSTPMTVAYGPYFTVMGGDVSAGVGFGACTNPTIDSKIVGNNSDTDGTGNPSYYGSGTNLAALALGSINSFATSLDTSTGSAVDSGAGMPSGLAFAGTGSGIGGTTYGGSFGRGAWCGPNYQSIAKTGQTSTTPSNPIDVNGLTKGTHYYNTDVVLSGTTLAQGKQVTVVVQGGNVTITGNILYNSHYSSIDTIPQLQVLVSGGNINIASNVTELHGFYDAQKTGANTGAIYSCTTSAGVPITGSDVTNDYNSCNQQLTIYGSVAAKTLMFGRTYGNLTAVSGVSNGPAEQIIYSPELWLGDLTGPEDGCSTTTGDTGCTFQAFTSLPPIL